MSQNKCPKCQHNIDGKPKFCPNCGEPLTKAAQEKAAKTKKSGSNSLRDTAIIVGLLAVVAVVYFLVKEKEVTPQQPVQQQSMESDHPDVGGMDPGAMQMLAQLPTDYNGLIQMGNQTMDAGNYPMAAECYKRALSIDPSSPDVRTDYGACLHGMGLEKRAAEEFQKVLHTYPNHSIAIFNLGIVYFTSGVPDSAKYYWKKFLEVEPTGQMADTARAYIKRLDG